MFLDIDGAKCVSISPHITYQAMREIHQKLETIIDLVKVNFCQNTHVIV